MAQSKTVKKEEKPEVKKQPDNLCDDCKNFIQIDIRLADGREKPHTSMCLLIKENPPGDVSNCNQFIGK